MSKRKCSTKALLASYKKRKRKVKKKGLLQKQPPEGETIPTAFQLVGEHRKMFSHHLPITVTPPLSGDLSIVSRMLSKPMFGWGSGRKGRRKDRKAQILPGKRGRGRPKKCPPVDSAMPEPSRCLSGLVTEEGDDTSIAKWLSFAEVELLGCFVYNARRPRKQGCRGSVPRKKPVKLSVRLAKIDKGDRSVNSDKTTIRSGCDWCWKCLSVPSVSCDVGIENVPSSEDFVCRDDSQGGRTRRYRKVAANSSRCTIAGTGENGRRKLRKEGESWNTDDLCGKANTASKSKNCECIQESSVALPVVAASLDVLTLKGDRSVGLVKREQNAGKGTIEAFEMGQRKRLEDGRACVPDIAPQSTREPSVRSVVSPLTIKTDSACGKVKFVLSKGLSPKELERQVEREAPQTAEDWYCQEVNFTGIRLKRENRKSVEGGEAEAETTNKPKKLKRSSSLLRNAKKCRPCSVALVDFVKCLNLSASSGASGHRSPVPCTSPDWKCSLKSIEHLETMGPISPIRISARPPRTPPDSCREVMDFTSSVRDDVINQKENAMASSQFLSGPVHNSLTVQMNHFRGRCPTKSIPSTDEHCHKEIRPFYSSECPLWRVGDDEYPLLYVDNDQGTEPRTKVRVHDKRSFADESKSNDIQMKLQLPKLKKILDSVVKASSSVATQSVVDGAWSERDAGCAKIVIVGCANSDKNSSTALEAIFPTPEGRIDLMRISLPGGTSRSLAKEGRTTPEITLRTKRSKAEPSSTMHTCIHCIFSTPNRVSMREHVYSHTNIIPFMCGLCGAMFGMQSAANLHSRRDHPGKDRQIIKDSTINAEDHYTTEYAATFSDCDESKIDAEESMIDADKCKINAKESTIDVVESRINAEESQIDAEKSKIDAQESMIDADKSVIGAEKSKIDVVESKIHAEESQINMSLISRSCHHPDVEGHVAAEFLASENSNVKTFPFKNQCQSAKTVESIEAARVFKDFTKVRNLNDNDPLIRNHCRIDPACHLEKMQNIDAIGVTSKEKIHHIQTKREPVLLVCLEKCTVDAAMTENSRSVRSSSKASTARSRATRRPPGPRYRAHKDRTTSLHSTASGGLPLDDSFRGQNRKPAGYSGQSLVNDHSVLPSTTLTDSPALPLSPVGEISIVTCRTASDASELNRLLLSPSSSSDHERRGRSASTRRYACLHCDYSTPDVADMENHVFVMHPRMKRLVCPICECYFCKWKPTMLAHFSDLHPKVKPVLEYEPSYLQKEDADSVSRGSTAALSHCLLKSQKRSPKKLQGQKSQSGGAVTSLRRSGQQGKTSGIPKSVSRTSVLLSGLALGISSTECQLIAADTQTSDIADENIDAVQGAMEDFKSVRNFKEGLVDKGSTSGGPSFGTGGYPDCDTNGNPNGGSRGNPEEPINYDCTTTNPDRMKLHQPVFVESVEDPSRRTTLSSSDRVLCTVSFHTTSKSTRQWSSVPCDLSGQKPTLDMDTLVTFENSETGQDVSLVQKSPNDSGEDVTGVPSVKADTSVRNWTEDSDAKSLRDSLQSLHHESSSSKCTISSNQSSGKLIDPCDSEKTSGGTGSENNEFALKLFISATVHAHRSEVENSVVQLETIDKDTTACIDMNPSRIISSSTSREPRNTIHPNSDVSAISKKDFDCSETDSGKDVPIGQAECGEYSGLLDGSAYSPRCVFAIGCAGFSNESFSLQVPVSSDVGKEAASYYDIISASDGNNVSLETEERTLTGDGCRSIVEGASCGTVVGVTDRNNYGKDPVESVEVIQATVVDEADSSDFSYCTGRNKIDVVCIKDEQNVDVSPGEEDNRNSEVDEIGLHCAVEDSVATDNDSDVARAPNSRFNCAVDYTADIVTHENDTHTEYDSNTTQIVDSRSDYVSSDSASILRSEYDSNTAQTADSRSGYVFINSANCVQSENDSSASQIPTSRFGNGSEEYYSSVCSVSDIFVTSSSVQNTRKEFRDEADGKNSMRADVDYVLGDNRPDGKCALEGDVAEAEKLARIYVASINNVLEADEVQSSRGDVFCAESVSTEIESAFGTEIKNVVGTEIESVICTEVENVYGTEVENVYGTEIENFYGTETENASGTEIKNIDGTEIEGIMVEDGTETFELPEVCDKRESKSCGFEKKNNYNSAIKDSVKTMAAFLPHSVSCIPEETDFVIGTIKKASEFGSCLDMEIPVPDTDIMAANVSIGRGDGDAQGGEKHHSQDSTKDGQFSEDMYEKVVALGLNAYIENGEVLVMNMQSGTSSAIVGGSEFDLKGVPNGIFANIFDDEDVSAADVDSEKALDSVITSKCNDKASETLIVESDKASSSVIIGDVIVDGSVGSVGVNSGMAFDIASERNDETIVTVVLKSEKASDDVIVGEGNDDGSIDSYAVNSEKVEAVDITSEFYCEVVGSVAVDWEKALDSVTADECYHEAVGTVDDVSGKAWDSVTASEFKDDVGTVAVDREKASNNVSECTDTVAMDSDKSSDIVSECNNEAIGTVSIDFEKASDSVTMSACNYKALNPGVYGAEEASASIIASLCDDKTTGHVNSVLNMSSDCYAACEYDDGTIDSIVVDTVEAVHRIVASFPVDEAIDSLALGSEKAFDSFTKAACCAEAFNSVAIDFEKASDSIFRLECKDIGTVRSSVSVGSSKFSDATDESKTSSHVVGEYKTSSHVVDESKTSSHDVDESKTSSHVVNESKTSSHVVDESKTSFHVVDEFPFDHTLLTGETSEGFSTNTDVLDQDQESSNVLTFQRNCFSENELHDLEPSELVVDHQSAIDSYIEQNAQEGLSASNESVQFKEAFDSVQKHSEQSSPVVVTSAVTLLTGISDGQNIQEYSSDLVDNSKVFDSVEACEHAALAAIPTVICSSLDAHQNSSVVSDGQNMPEISSVLADRNKAFDNVEDCGHTALATLPTLICYQPESSVIFALTQHSKAVDPVQDSGQGSQLLTDPVSTVLAEPESTSALDLSEESRGDHVWTEEAVSILVRSEDCMCLEVSSTSDEPVVDPPEVRSLGAVPTNEGAVLTPEFATDDELDVETYTEEEPEKRGSGKESEEPCSRKETSPEDATVCRYCSFDCADKEIMTQHLHERHRMQLENSSSQWDQHSSVQSLHEELSESHVATKPSDDGYDLRTVNVIIIEPNNDWVARKRRHSASTDDLGGLEPIKHCCQVAVPSSSDEDDVIFVREEKLPLAASHSSRPDMHPSLSSEGRPSDVRLAKPDAAASYSSFMMNPADVGVDTGSVAGRQTFVAPENDVRRVRGQDIVSQEQRGHQYSFNINEMSCGRAPNVVVAMDTCDHNPHRLVAMDSMHRRGDSLEPFLSDSCSSRFLDTTNSSQWTSNPVNYAFVTRAICRPIMSTMTLDQVPYRHLKAATGLVDRQVQQRTDNSVYRGKAPNVVVAMAKDACDRNPHRLVTTRVAGPPPLMHISELQTRDNLGTGSRFYPDAVGQTPGNHIPRNPATGSRLIESRADFGSRQTAHIARSTSDVQDFTGPLSNNRWDAARPPCDVQGDYMARPLVHSGGTSIRALDDNRANQATRHAADNPLVNYRSDHMTKHLVDNNRVKPTARPYADNRADNVARHLSENCREFANGPLVDNPADHLTRHLSDDYALLLDNRGNHASNPSAGDFARGRNAMVPPPAHSKLPVRQLPMRVSSFLPTNIQPNMDNARIPCDIAHAYPAHLQASNSSGNFQGMVRGGGNPPPAHLPQRSQAHMPPNILRTHSYPWPSHGTFDPPRARHLEAAASSTNSCLLCSFQAADRWSLYNHILTHSLPDHGN